MTERPDVKYQGFVPKGEYRTWTSGRYSVEAMFVLSENDRVTLRNMYGGEIVVPLDRLSDKDRRWIRRELNKPPPEEKETTPDMTERPDAAKPKGIVPNMTERPDAADRIDPVLPRMTKRPDAARETKMVNLFTIYNKKTSDYPGVMVMRRWEVGGSIAESGVAKAIMTPKEVVGTGNTLEEMRKLLPEGCTNLGRFDQEDPNIVESWMQR
jgi:hypothetical protein